jgi:DNA-binding response OmpR family regulator
VVAVVDDDAATVDAMRTLFETWGATVAWGDALEALIASLGRLGRYPDLIVADLRLADGRSGIDAVRSLRHELGLPVPAIVVSGDTGTRAEREAKAAGLMLLPKPVVGATLRATALALVAREDATSASSSRTQVFVDAPPRAAYAPPPHDSRETSLDLPSSRIAL